MCGKTSYGVLAAAIVGTALLPLSGARGATVTFQNGAANAFTGDYEGTQSTQLFGYAGDLNAGAAGVAQIGTNDNSGARPAIIQFGGLNVMAGQYSTIDSAQLILFQVNSQPVPAMNVSAYQLSDNNAGWVQGIQNYADATSGGATWNDKSSFGSGNASNVPWAGGVGGPTVAGTDYTTFQSTVQVNDSNAVETPYTWDLKPATVDYWINHNSLNAGLVLFSDDYTSLWTFYGNQETGNFLVRPELVINYTPLPVPEPLSGSLLLVGGGLLALRRRRK